jgi:hypothetical protein
MERFCSRKERVNTFGRSGVIQSEGVSPKRRGYTLGKMRHKFGKGVVKLKEEL